VAGAVADLKQQAGQNVTVLGSGELVQSLMFDLIDEYSLTVSPIVLGSGKRLFRHSDQARSLRLVDSKATSTGSLILTYRPGWRERAVTAAQEASQRPSALAASTWAKPDGRMRPWAMRRAARSLLRADHVDRGRLG
jgi:RibD C-terminal domain